MKSPLESSSKKKVIRTAAIAGSLYSLLSGQLAFLNKHYEIIGVATAKKEYFDILERIEGIKTKGIPIERTISPLKDLKSLFALYSYFRKEKPDMVHSITPKAGLLSMTAAYFARVPVRAHTFTGLLFPTETGFKRRLLLFLDKLICTFATHIYPEGQGVKNDLIDHKITTKPMKIIANGNINGKDLKYFDPALFSKDDLFLKRKELGIHENDFVFVSIGRIVNDKGINELVNAFCKLYEKHRNLKLLLIGHHKGESDVLPEKTWEKINNEERILFIGPKKDIRPYLALSDTLAFPSYREGFPNVVLEAGAMGLPSIVTDINGCNEIIVPKKNGLIIPSKDEQALLMAMEELVENKVLREELAKHSRPMIVSRYDQKLVWEAQLAEYQRILD